MRSRETEMQRSREKIWRKRTFSFFYASMFLCLLASSLFVGCVRVAGTAGYAKVNADGETTVKRAGFDTANLVPQDKTQGSMTL